MAVRGDKGGIDLRDGGHLLESGDQVTVVALCHQGLDEQIEQRRPLAVLLGEASQPPTDQRDGHLRRALGEMQRSAGERRRRLVLESGKETFRIVEAALGQPQFGQLGGSFGMNDGLGPRPDVQSRLQLLICLLPIPNREQDTSVVRAASRVQMSRPVTAGEVVGSADPLHHPLEVCRSAARRDRAATDENDRVEIAAFASESGGHRLIEQSRTLVHVADLDKRGPQLAHRAQHKVRVAVLPSEHQRFPCTTLSHVRLRLVVGQVGLTQQNPAAHRRQPELIDEPCRPSRPPSGSRGVAQTHLESEAQVDRAQDRLSGIGPLTKHGIGALPAAQRFICISTPPASDPQPEQRLSSLSRLQHGPVALLRGSPLTRPQRLISRADQFVDLHLHWPGSYEHADPGPAATESARFSLGEALDIRGHSHTLEDDRARLITGIPKRRGHHVRALLSLGRLTSTWPRRRGSAALAAARPVVQAPLRRSDLDVGADLEDLS